MVQEASILIEKLTGDSAYVGGTGKQSVNILVVWQGGVVEVGQEP